MSIEIAIAHWSADLESAFRNSAISHASVSGQVKLTHQPARKASCKLLQTGAPN
jgi:hypothetical protein